MTADYDKYDVIQAAESKCPSLMEPLVFKMNKEVFDKYEYLSILNYESSKKTFTTVLKTEIFLSVQAQVAILNMFKKYVEYNADFFLEDFFNKHESGSEFYLNLIIVNDQSMIIFNEQVKIVS